MSDIRNDTIKRSDAIEAAYEYKEYAGCRNCKHQPELLKMREWGERRDVVEPICSGWELKGANNE